MYPKTSKVLTRSVAKRRRLSITVPKTFCDKNANSHVRQHNSESTKGTSSHGLSQRTSQSIHPSSNRIIINVGGERFETYRSTLKNIPDTRLAWLADSCSAANCEYHPDTNEYFFDRHPGVFNMILNYYRTGKLHTPMDVCGPMFEEELMFWGIDETDIEPCCWTSYRTHRMAQETLAELRSLGHRNDSSDSLTDDLKNTAERFGIEESTTDHKINHFERIRSLVWLHLEDPRSGTIGKAIAAIKITFIVLSIAFMCFETLENLRVPRNGDNKTNNSIISTGMKVSEFIDATQPHIVLVTFDYFLTTYFFLELLVRFIFCPKKVTFFKSILNWIDIIALLNSIVMIILEYTKATASKWMQLLGVLRIFRIFKLTRHFAGLKILVHTLKASSKELILLAVVFAIFVMVYGTVIYTFEQFIEHERNQIRNIPMGFWWALVTMTTVGYGDIVPMSVPGYMIGVLCVVSGVLVIALPVPIIVNNFALYYSHAQAQQKLPKKKRRIVVGAPELINVPNPADLTPTSTRTPSFALGEDDQISTTSKTIWDNPAADSTSNAEENRHDQEDSTSVESTCGGIKITVVDTDQQKDRISMSNGSLKDPCVMKTRKSLSYQGIINDNTSPFDAGDIVDTVSNNFSDKDSQNKVSRVMRRSAIVVKADVDHIE